MLTAAATTFGEGFIPIPFSDATLLIPTQITMLASITACFGLNIDKGTIATIVSSVLGTGGATITGKMIATNVIKLVPGGNIVGGVISGATASLITIALGESYILLLESVYKGELNSSDISSDKGKKILQELFKQRIDANKKKNLFDKFFRKADADF